MKILFSFFMIFVVLMVVVFLSKKYKLRKEQLNIFILLVLVWTAVSIIRSYRKLYATSTLDEGGLALTAEMAAQIAAAYGLMSLFVRLPMFFISDYIGKRKIFIQTAIVLLTVSSFLVAWSPSYNTLYFSSLALGFAATMIAMFNVIFSETFAKESAAVSVSILSAAPLLAEFIAAPIQYLFTHSDVKAYNMMWLVSAVLSLVTFFFSLKIKDQISTERVFSISKVKFVLKHKSFIYVCILGILVSFIKFATSGANMLSFAKSQLKIGPLMLAYMDTVFVIPQLISGILVGTYLTRKFGVQKSLLGLFTAAVAFFLIVLYVNNPYIVYASYLLNGAFYGGVYNILISMAMQYFDREFRSVSMGIYQGFFAVGIYYADYIYVWLARYFKEGILGFGQSKVIFLICLILTIISMLMVKLRVKN